MRGATRFYGVHRLVRPNFNPRTPCGVRLVVKRDIRFFVDISIHAPHAGCDNVQHTVPRFCDISIHAPLAGCDDHLIFAAACRLYFNPRTPCGVRRALLSRIIGARRFQSTHPLRGATYDVSAIFTQVYISIHAPLAGCDDCPPRS